MNSQMASIVGASAAAALLLLLLAPRSDYEPGALLAAHRQLSGDCTTCHRPWHGPLNDKCVRCHGNLRDENRHSGLDVSQTDIGLFARRTLVVSATGTLECLSCHGEHEGAAVEVKAAASLACTWCHKHPTIGKVAEHLVPVMQRQFSMRHLFRRQFNHYEHRRLIESHYPLLAGGFACVSCHAASAVKPGEHERMSLKWSGCAGMGCHIASHDSFMQMPASAGPPQATIAYSAAVPVRHINAVFVHSAGHLESRCEECHLKVVASRSPDDANSLAIKQCFTCHAHQAAVARKQDAVAESRNRLFGQTAFAPAAMRPRHEPVIACRNCHLFHTYGVVPLRDFLGAAPQFPPNDRRSFTLTVYVLRWSPGHGRGAIKLHPVVLTPWWIGLLATALVSVSLMAFIRALRRKAAAHE
jgi:Cytochrome c3